MCVIGIILNNLMKEIELFLYLQLNLFEIDIANILYVNTLIFPSLF